VLSAIDEHIRSGPGVLRDKPSLQSIHRVLQLVLYAQRGIVEEADALLAGYGYGRAHFRMLYIIARLPGTNLKALTDGLGVSHQAASQLLRELLRDGFVRQLSDLDDKRKRLLFLTSEGDRLQSAVYDKQAKVIGRALATLGKAGVEHFVQGLESLVSPSDQAIVELLGRSLDDFE
jgi:DNA-binding MarR family transcriptional regulator